MEDTAAKVELLGLRLLSLIVRSLLGTFSILVDELILSLFDDKFSRVVIEIEEVREIR